LMPPCARRTAHRSHAPVQPMLLEQQVNRFRANPCV
jgi:hypothetical protein